MTGQGATNGQPAGDHSLDAIVIGASQAGPAMAWDLAQHKLRFVVLEAADEVGR
jgi:cation diffusion facilitator CzcD-associated flavoprotein CzcO